MEAEANFISRGLGGLRRQVWDRAMAGRKSHDEARATSNGARNTAAEASHQRGNRAAAADFDLSREMFGAGGGWANPDYGTYYATSVSVYAAIKLRADAVVVQGKCQG